TVNIALVENGVAILGVVYAPVLDVAYLGLKGMGAFKVDANGRHPIQVAEYAEGEAWRVVGSRSHAGAETAAWLEKLGAHEMVSMGSSLKLCLVAEGAADVYPRLGPTSLWDTAAAQAVVEQAGGAVIQIDGAPLSYADTAQVLNPYFIVHGKSAQDWAALGAS
ncbi:MAG: 3'(2'),5'-bisphosphate nucleotidase CysQ, partial [Oceanospirillaceae bacterium]|nr:3'(2'),5'-bisphosphate nucleotidase CysQ [Oceanospirillaceae bacterium]